MKTLFTSILAVAISLTALAQNPDKALARVSYTFTHIQDTTQKDKPYTENMLLVIGKNASVYTSYDRINRNLEMEKQIQDQIKNQTGLSNMNITVGTPGVQNKLTNPLDYFFFAKENKFFTKERIFTNYLVEEEAPKIDWKIKKDTASFSGIKCQKATTSFKGRNWIVWYAPELPFQSGPWKLNGLPGLIIEAYDETQTVHFQFAGMNNNIIAETTPTDEVMKKITAPNGAVAAVMGTENTSYLGAEIKLPVDGIKTTLKEIDKLKEARAKDPQGFMKAQMASSGLQVSGVSSMVRTGSPSGAPKALPKIVINNPLELPEKK